jgi:serine/threonine protein phosphatase PrpC
MSKDEQGPFVVSAAACTDKGRVRKHNEDFVAYQVPEDPSQEAAYGSLFLVCDGVGGGMAGEVASEHAGRRILVEYYQAPADQPPLARLANAIQLANREVFHENREQPEGRRMTTTVVAAVVVGSHLFLAHTGDSRAYLVRDGQIAPVTRDHSWVAEMVRSGDLTPAEAESHPWRNRITRALGMSETIEVEERSIEVVQGDVIILCSDGLTRHVENQELLDTVTHHWASDAAKRLIDLANERGGTDNISVIIADLLPPGTNQGHKQAGHGHKHQNTMPAKPAGAWPASQSS